MSQNKYNDAQKYFLQLYSKNKTGKTANLIGNIYERQKNYKLAEQYYNEALSLGEKNAVYNIAMLYQSQENYEQAQKYLENLAQNSRNPELYYNLALSYDMGKNKTEAEKNYLKAIELAPGNNDVSLKAMNNLGLLYYEQGNKDMAVKYLKNAVDNGYYSAALDLGIIYGQLGDKENTEKYLLTALEKGKITVHFITLESYIMIRGKKTQL